MHRIGPQRPVRVTAPAELPLSLAEAKQRLRVLHDDEDEDITSLIRTATEMLDGDEGELGRCLVTQTWRMDLAAWPCDGVIRLRLPPVQSATVAYVAPDDTVASLDPAAFWLVTDDFGPALVRPRGTEWPALAYRPDAVRVTFVAGFGAATDVPEPIRQAIYLLVCDWFENREATIVGTISGDLKPGIDRLLWLYREVAF